MIETNRDLQSICCDKDENEIINLSVYEINTSFHARSEIDVNRVREFINLIQSKQEFPPIKVAQHDNTWYCLDGHHELKAYQELSLPYIKCEVLENIHPLHFRLHSAKYNLKSSKPLSVDELTKLVVDSIYNKNIPADDVVDILAISKTYIYKIIRPYKRTKIESEISNVLKLHSEGNNASVISEKTGIPLKRVIKWINHHLDPLSEDKELFATLKNKSENIYKEKELDTFLTIQAIKRDDDLVKIANDITANKKAIVTIAYMILYCYQNEDKSCDEFMNYFHTSNKDQILMIQFMQQSLDKTLPPRDFVFEWIKRNDTFHDEHFRKIYHEEMLFRIKYDNEQTNIQGSQEIKPQTRGRKKEGPAIEYFNDESVDFFDPKQLAKVVDKFKVIEDEVVVNKKPFDSKKAQKILEQINRLMIMINTIIPELSKQINFK